MTVPDEETEDVAAAPEYTAVVDPVTGAISITGLADIIPDENSMHTPESKCQLGQEFYWALLQILDRDNDGVMSIDEFEDSADTLSGIMQFGNSESLLGWFEDNAIRISANQGNVITSREILDQSPHDDISEEDFMALDILIYYSDAFYSYPGWDGDGLILMQRLSVAMDELADALGDLQLDGWF